MRNHFEHFDERIGRWWKGSSMHIFVDGNLGPVSIKGDNIDQKDFFRGLDPATGHLSFWGTKLNMRDVYAEVEQILARVEVEVDKTMLPAHLRGAP